MFTASPEWIQNWEARIEQQQSHIGEYIKSLVLNEIERDISTQRQKETKVLETWRLNSMEYYNTKGNENRPQQNGYSSETQERKEVF